ncbi:transporter, partial [Microbacteriaceae bacterium K1510]|nr:transporter [Microbacteriaceae bacterium K1510]
VLKDKTGIGDVLFGPFLQFDPIMGKNGPVFVHRIEFQVIAPTGEYDRNAAVQPGSNFWSFDPYWAGTWFITPEWTASTRIHYLWNGQNDDPNVSFGPGVSSTRAGQAVHLNFASEYALTKSLRAGVNGYYLKQTTDTQADGVDIPGSREQVFGIGPGILYSWGKEQHLFLNAYKEFAAENRPEGERFFARYVQHFDW